MGNLAQQYFWICANYQGRLIILGPHGTSEEANSYAYSKLDVAFEIIPLKTRDRSRAAAIIKNKRLSETADLGGAIKRSMRRAPEDYRNAWWGQGR